ncbi:hypothetical protein [Rhodopseudomonas palustris]|uniref:Uncharacterized protein n=1 Tax=Rhodopseudomonas palustris TaxID=1076 RepID=A0A418V170_RHOPL|nr:hypothetical protein [Rhodopseudomonas palustris]RJF69595.1 hypothetical protein D4Q52_19765 [Rhodopseudomonas palustris]
MAMKTIRAPITLFYEGQYVPPGTPVTLSIEEANNLIDRYGDIGDAEVVLSMKDLANIDELNRQHARFNS